MPTIGQSHPTDSTKYWDGTSWQKKSLKGSGKSGEQLAGELGFKGDMTAASAHKDRGTGSLADRAARAKAKSLEEQAKAVEAEKKKKAQAKP